MDPQTTHLADEETEAESSHCWRSCKAATCLSGLLSTEKKTFEDRRPQVQRFSRGEPPVSGGGHGWERPESSPPPDGGGRGLRATAAAAARGDAGTPGGGVSAGKTEEIKTRRASLPAAWPPLQPAGAWGAGGGRCAAPSPERGRPGARGLQDGPQSRFPASAQVQVVSGDPPRTCWPQAVSAVPAVPRCRAAPGVRRQPPAAEVAPSPHLRPGLRASGARPATPGFPRPETTEGSPEWNRGSPFPTEKETLATPLTRARPGLDPHGPPGLPSRGLESRPRCPDPGVRAPAAPAPCQVQVAGVGAWGGAPGVSGNAWGRRRGHRRGRGPGPGRGQPGHPPPPAGLRAGAVTSRSWQCPARRRGRGRGPSRRFISGARRARRAAARVPAPPAGPGPAPRSRSRPLGGWVARDRAPGGWRDEGRAAGGRGA